MQIKIILFALFLLIFSGCTTIYFKDPLIFSSNYTDQNISGYWLASKQTYKYHLFISEKDDHMRGTLVSINKNGQEPNPYYLDIWCSQFSNLYILNTKPLLESNNSDYYQIYLYNLQSKNKLKISLLDTDKFKELVEEGDIKGHLNTNTKNIYIYDTPSNTALYLISNQNLIADDTYQFKRKK